MDNEVILSVEDSAQEVSTSDSKDLTSSVVDFSNYGFDFSTWGIDVSTLGISTPASLSNAFSPSGTNSVRFVGGNASGISASISFNDIVSGYSFFNKTDNYSAYNYDIGSYSNGNTTVNYFNESSVSSSSSYTQSTFYDVGNHNGYLNNFNNKTGVMNFVDVNISSWERNNDYVSFDMGNGTSFQAQTSNSTDDIFQYSTDGQNVSYAKLGMTNQNNSFTYTDGVTFIGSTDHEDTLNLSTYDRNVNLNGGEYINIDNIDARNSSGTYYQRQLIGNTGNNKIYAGGGDLLWGGEGSGDDELYGGEGENTYYYGVSEGNDVIRQSVATDKVDLYNVSLSDISDYDYSGSNFVLKMAGGQSLVIEGQDGASNFVLADRSEYSYNRQTDTWTQTKAAEV